MYTEYLRLASATRLELYQFYIFCPHSRRPYQRFAKNNESIDSIKYFQHSIYVRVRCVGIALRTDACNRVKIYKDIAYGKYIIG